MSTDSKSFLLAGVNSSTRVQADEVFLEIMCQRVAESK